MTATQTVATTITEPWKGECCTDCAFLIAHGDTPREWGEYETAEWLATIDERLEGVNVILDDGANFFSYAECEVCGNAAGGDRWTVTFTMEEAK